MQPTLPKFGNLTPELKLPDSCTVVAWEWSQFTGLATEMGLPVERAELLMCRGLATLRTRLPGRGPMRDVPPDAGATVSSCDNASLF